MTKHFHAVLCAILALILGSFGVYCLIGGALLFAVISLCAAGVLAIAALRSAGFIPEAVDAGDGQ